MKKITFLVNGAARRRGRKRTARSSARTRSAPVQSRRKRRPPPAGWSSWKLYMASIRPNGASSGTRRRSTMKKGTRRRSSTSIVRHSRRGVTRHYRRAPTRGFRHNPPISVSRITSFATETVIGAGGVLGGKIVARKGRSLAGQAPGTVLGSVIEAGIGIAAGLALSMVSPKMGQYVAIGGVLAPMETLIQQLNIPIISASLADDAFLFAGDTGVTLVNAYEDQPLQDDQQLREYTDGRQATLSEFVEAGTRAA